MGAKKYEYLRIMLALTYQIGNIYRESMGAHSVRGVDGAICDLRHAIANEMNLGYLPEGL